jgi:hypothetical protein
MSVATELPLAETKQLPLACWAVTEIEYGTHVPISLHASERLAAAEATRRNQTSSNRERYRVRLMIIHTQAIEP